MGRPDIAETDIAEAEISEAEISETAGDPPLPALLTGSFSGSGSDRVCTRVSFPLGGQAAPTRGSCVDPVGMGDQRLSFGRRLDSGDYAGDECWILGSAPDRRYDLCIRVPSCPASQFAGT